MFKDPIDVSRASRMSSLRNEVIEKAQARRKLATKIGIKEVPSKIYNETGGDLFTKLKQPVLAQRSEKPSALREISEHGYEIIKKIERQNPLSVFSKDKNLPLS